MSHVCHPRLFGSDDTMSDPFMVATISPLTVSSIVMGSIGSVLRDRDFEEAMLACAAVVRDQGIEPDRPRFTGQVVHVDLELAG